MGREDTSTGMAGNDGHCVGGGGGKIAESIVTKKKKGCGALCVFLQNQRERQRKEQRKREILPIHGGHTSRTSLAVAGAEQQTHREGVTPFPLLWVYFKHLHHKLKHKLETALD